MMSAVDDRPNFETESASPVRTNDYDLKFVPVEEDGEEAAGGWYRELPGAQIEVLSRAHLERVPLDDSSNPEQKAREKIAEMIKRVDPKQRR